MGDAPRVLSVVCDGRNWGVTCEMKGSRRASWGWLCGDSREVCGDVGLEGFGMFSGGRVDVMELWDGFGEPRDCVLLLLVADVWGFWGVFADS